VSALQADVTGNLQWHSVAPAPGVLGGAAGGHLALALTECASLPVRLGSFLVLPPGVGSLCLLNARLASCTQPAEQFLWPDDLRVTGASTDGGAWCDYGRGCGELEPGGSTPVGVPAAPPPAADEFRGAAPNPFRAETSLAFALRDPASVRLAIFDVTGRRIRVLRNGRHGAGRHQAAWDGRDDAGRAVPAGLYFVRIEAGALVETRKLVMLGR